MVEFIAPLVAIVVAMGGAWWVQRASGAKEITEATKVLIDPLTERIDCLYVELEEHQRKLDEQGEYIENQRGAIQEQQETINRQGKLIEAQRLEIEDLKAQRRSNERRIARIERWARLLRDQVIALGGTPVDADEVV
jgi:septal ring factor EnvC (AmiA/AmiB activator)